MSDAQGSFIDIDRLEVGMYVHLDLGWTEHPFPLSSFRIRSRQQIETLRSLGLERVRYSPEKGEAAPETASVPPPDAAASQEAALPRVRRKQRRRQILDSQQASLAFSERQFADASDRFRKALKETLRDPVAAHRQVQAMVSDILGEIAADSEVAIRLLSDKAGGDLTVHPIHVTIISLLLGKACGLGREAMEALGTGALLHDMGKLVLPERLHWTEDLLSPAERPLFRSHVGQGVTLAETMGLSPVALGVIGQHHEFADGSGYPQGLQGAGMSPGGKILSIVNYYDNLCHPGHPAQAMTPHDALAQMFAGSRQLFDPDILTRFIRMMGVYPPGSVVELSDARFALVMTVNSSRPLKPQVVIYEPRVPKGDAVIVDLENEPELGIRRSLPPLQLPRRVFDYLSPRKRICYFFERAREAGTRGERL